MVNKVLLIGNLGKDEMTKKMYRYLGGVSVWLYESGLVYKLFGHGDLNEMWLELPEDSKVVDINGITCVRRPGCQYPEELNYLIRAGIITPRPDMYNLEQFPLTIKSAVVLEKIFIAVGKTPPDYVLQVSRFAGVGSLCGTCRYCGGVMSPGRSLSLSNLSSGNTCLSCGRP